MSHFTSNNGGGGGQSWKVGELSQEESTAGRGRRETGIITSG